MGVFKDIIINIVGALLFFLLGLLVQKCATYVRAKGKTRIWSRFANGKELHVAISIREGPLARSTPRTSIAEVIALAQIVPFLQQLKVDFKILDFYPDSSSSAGKNLIALGGPCANALTVKLMESYKSILPMKFSSEPRYIQVGERVYTPQYDNECKTVMTDYALVVVANNPYDMQRESGSSTVSVLVMGCHGYGTRGGVEALSSKELTKKLNKFKINSSFAAVIRVDKQAGVYKSSVEEIYPLLND